jgi:hypothetical protein
VVEVLAKEEEGELGMEEVVLATGHLQEYEGTALRKNKGKRSKSRKEQEAPSPHPRHPRHAGRVIPGGVRGAGGAAPAGGGRRQQGRGGAVRGASPRPHQPEPSLQAGQSVRAGRRAR